MNNDEILLNSEIIKTPTDILFTMKNSNEILSIVSCTIENGNIKEIIKDDGTVLSRNEINIYSNVLFVPGIGSIKSGTYVYYRGIQYLLLFGWHTNISNQTIYSWFLRSLDNEEADKTLYKWMIDEIDILGFVSEVLYNE